MEAESETTPQGMREGVLNCEEEACRPSGLGRLWALAPSAGCIGRMPPLHSSVDAAVPDRLRKNGGKRSEGVRGSVDGCSANRHGFGYGSGCRRAPSCRADSGAGDSEQADGQADASRGQSGMSRSPSRWSRHGGAGIARVSAGTGHRRLPIAWMLGKRPVRYERCTSLPMLGCFCLRPRPAMRTPVGGRLPACSVSLRAACGFAGVMALLGVLCPAMAAAVDPPENRCPSAS